MGPTERNVVVGVDLSARGDDAIVAALCQLEAEPNSVLHLMHVLDPREVVDDPDRRALESEVDFLERAPHMLEARARDLASLHGRPWVASRVRTHARLGEPVTVLLQTCVDYEADLLIVGTHGRRGMDRLLLGSVAEKLVRIAHCPVLVARAKEYAGLEKTALPDAPYAPGTAPQHSVQADELHVASTTLDSWHPSDNGPTGFRIV
jgi:nucleotide-binding universal stress UspA family protein